MAPTHFYHSHFHDKVVFLTGATGNTGSCILYKLIVRLVVRHVYVLVRGSRDRAIRKIASKMPAYPNSMLASGKISFVVGDVAAPDLGLQPAVVQTMKREVNILIHTAASISLLAPIKRCIRDNCDPTLELARLATDFDKLECFVHVSTAYANSFLPDGVVKERLYPLDVLDPELERETILRTGTSEYTDRFAFPYAFSKYLAERLLMSRFPELPILIIRPSIIGPALKEPFPLFGTPESLPMTQFLRLYISDAEDNRTWHLPQNSSSGTNIVDEVPVDWVSNILLLHVAAQTSGIVHASSGTYVPQTFDEHHISVLQGASRKVAAELPPFDWTADTSLPQCALAAFYRVGNRDWHFDCARSARMRGVGGPLGINVTAIERDRLNVARFTKLVEEKWAEERRDQRVAKL